MQAALLRSARTLLEKEGITALRLRAITRHAGVSPMAAMPHFGNLTGLLSTLAAIGYEELADTMEPVITQDHHAIGMAYVNFAITRPGLFTLMFRSDAIDRNHPRLSAAQNRTSAMLTQVAETSGQTQGPHTHTGLKAALWGKVHGLAVLAIDGLLAPLLQDETSSETFAELISDALR
ncbi:TetR-like C-terminal domain-containing protein [Acetobacter oeni]|nr:TetR-like C-terminal domain-containing protein [Acetobacter oeni]NHO19409.1 TetR family transcriptional regulator [Acetobacter oeni]